MPTAEIKVDIFRLTISGLQSNSDYCDLIMAAATDLRSDTKAVTITVNRKTHALSDFRKSESYQNCIGLRFLSYKSGHRPDILNTQDFSLQSSPLAPDQANVEWTHALVGTDPSRPGKFLLLLENNFHGIHSGTLEYYLQRLLRKISPTKLAKVGQAVVVSLTSEPGVQFIQRLHDLDRISTATLRVVRPNPGWRDLESLLSEEADESDARRIDLEMAARRGASLSKKEGLVARILQKFTNRTLDYAAISGNRNGKPDSFNTDKLGKKAMATVETDSFGQIDAAAAWKELAKILRNLK